MASAAAAALSAGAAQAQILFGDDKAVLGIAQNFQARFRGLAERGFV